MKRIKYHHHLPQSNRLMIESIRLELKRQQSSIAPRNRFNTLPDEHGLQLFRSNTKIKKLHTDPVIEENKTTQLQENYSIPVKLNQWNSIQQEQMKRIKSNIQKIKLLKFTQATAQQAEGKRSILEGGPSIFVKDMFREGSEKIEKQQKKINNILKFKSFKGINLIRKQKSKDYFSENLAVSPIKISVQLPKIRQRETQILKYSHKGSLSNPYAKIERSLILKKNDSKKYKKWQFNELSPWQTKGQIFNTSGIAIQ